MPPLNVGVCIISVNMALFLIVSYFFNVVKMVLWVWMAHVAG